MLTDDIINTDDTTFSSGDDLVGYHVDSEQHQDFAIDLGGPYEVNGYAIHGWCSNDANDYIWNLRHYTVSYLDASENWKTLEDKPDRLAYTPDTPACYTWQAAANLSPQAKSAFHFKCGVSDCF